MRVRYKEIEKLPVDSIVVASNNASSLAQFHFTLANICERLPGICIFCAALTKISCRCHPCGYVR